MLALALVLLPRGAHSREARCPHATIPDADFEAWRSDPQVIFTRHVRPIGTSWAPFRAFFDTYSIDNPVDRRTCYLGSDKIKGGFLGKMCNPDWYVTASKIAGIKSNLKFIEELLHEMVRVVPDAGSIRPLYQGSDTRLDGSEPTEIWDCDLFVRVLCRPDEDAGQAFGFHNVYADDGRPVAGVLNVHPGTAPTELNMSFISVVLHQVFHVMGWTADMVDNWLDPKTGERYETKPWYVHKDEMFGKQWIVWVGRKAHKWATAEYDNEEFWPGEKSGIVMEDTNGKEGSGDDARGARMSHLKSSVYWGDIMTVLSTYEYVTVPSLVMLMDTGWYKVNLSYAETNPYTTPEMWNEKRDKKMAIGPPTTARPKDFYCRTWPTYQCSWDREAIIRCERMRENPCNRSMFKKFLYTRQCLGRKYYLPNNNSIVSKDPERDYMPLGLHMVSCTNTDVFLPGTQTSRFIPGPDSYCALSTLDRNALHVEPDPGCFPMRCKKVGNTTVVEVKFYDMDRPVKILCKQEGKKIVDSFAGYFSCPDPVKLCRSRKWKMRQHEKSLWRVQSVGTRRGFEDLAFLGDERGDNLLAIRAAVCCIIAIVLAVCVHAKFWKGKLSTKALAQSIDQMQDQLYN